ncbi:class I SAM-dependent methyltransferase [Hydrogenophaga sp. IBVHS1]|uniref:class I SAM-dependent methyltransferase n=1 Tax=unclassified Hydrogenophaga TaxID=2610897 RepID=UPI000A2E700B|nr:methyltransferase domain-containing protein [Hydrogenophaga sp. IBVHS1]OSZ75060.1 dimethylmenaquinone methyltransferase [Hydrogenophaga sp. IBVHS1]
MEPRLQRRVQRYGWDLAADDYEPLWQAQLAPAQAELLAQVALAPGERVLDVACGTGLVTLPAARAVGPHGRVLGVDISERMVQTTLHRARAEQLHQVDAARMDAEQLALPDAGFDVALCAFGLMYLPEPEQALRELRRVLRPGGRLGLAIWGERARCGWSALFPIVDAEVTSEVCPLFFRLGQADTLVRLCAQAGFNDMQTMRISTTLRYTHADDACRAAFVGGPVALAWSRMDEAARERVSAAYLQAIDGWRTGAGYAVPAEFLISTATSPS